jgi:Transposase DDE domain
MAASGSGSPARSPVACDRVVSVVDPDARHGHTTTRPHDHTTTRPARGALTVTRGMPRSTPTASWSELVMAITATAGNVGDAAAAPELLAELVAQVDDQQPAPPTGSTEAELPAPRLPPTVTVPMAPGRCWPACTPLGSTRWSRSKPRSHHAGISPTPSYFTNAQFQIDLAAGTVTCPAQRTAAIVYTADPDNRHHGQASFGPACASCPLRGQCTSAAAGRTITITITITHHHRLRGRAGRCPHSPGRPRPRRRLPRRRLPRHPTQGRAQARPSGAIWCAAATAAAACGSVAWSRCPPTSTCWPPRSTWLGWACSACTGPQRTAGQQPEPTRHHADQQQPRRSAPAASPEPTWPGAARPPTHAGASMPTAPQP